MNYEPNITFHNIGNSDAIKQDVLDHIEKLDQFHDRITGCRVVIDAPHKHQKKGNIYDIRIDVLIPGGEIIINKEPGQNHAHEDIYVAIRDAFNAAKRKLEDHVRKHSVHRTKHHPTPGHGTIVRLFVDEGYGFIETEDAREIYFGMDCVAKGGWDALDIGMQVRFIEADGDKGPYARTVNLL